MRKKEKLCEAFLASVKTCFPTYDAFRKDVCLTLEKGVIVPSFPFKGSTLIFFGNKVEASSSSFSPFLSRKLRVLHLGASLFPDSNRKKIGEWPVESQSSGHCWLRNFQIVNFLHSFSASNMNLHSAMRKEFMSLASRIKLMHNQPKKSTFFFLLPGFFSFFSFLWLFRPRSLLSGLIYSLVCRARQRDFFFFFFSAKAKGKSCCSVSRRRRNKKEIISIFSIANPRGEVRHLTMAGRPATSSQDF